MPTVDERITAVEGRVTKLEHGGGMLAWLDAKIQGNAKLSAMLAGLLFAAIAWLTTWLSVPATVHVPVPGPEKVIVKEVPPQQPAPEVKGGAVPLREGK